MKGTPTYTSWTAAKQRVTNPNNDRWEHYGGRGITMCEDWLADFCNFFSDMGIRPIGTSLERLNVNGNYEPDNCIWIKDELQAKNRRNTVYLTFHDKRSRQTLTGDYDFWAERTGLPRGCVKRRNELGWPIEDILKVPYKINYVTAKLDDMHGEVTLTLDEWSKVTGISRRTLHDRIIENKIDPVQALTTKTKLHRASWKVAK